MKLTDEQKKKRGTVHEEELGFVHYGELASGLKSTIYKCVTNNDRVYAYENEGRYMMKALFDFYCEESRYLPSEYRADNIFRQYSTFYEGQDKEQIQKRLIIDYISGMMDEYLKHVYGKLKDTMRQSQEIGRKNEKNE